MTDDERERIRKVALEEAGVLERIRTLERDRDEIHAQNKTLITAVSQLTMRNAELEKDVKEAIDYKRTLDRYKSRLAWAIVLGAVALILRPIIAAWDRVLAVVGLN